MPMQPTRRDWLAAGAAGLASCAAAPKTETFTIADRSESPGGMPAVVLARTGSPSGSAPALVEAHILPGRGFNTWQLRAYLPGKGVTDLITAPSLSQAVKLMNGGPDDFRGNESFKNGGALLIPYANRLRGKFDEKTRTIQTAAAGKSIHLPANWKGKNPGAEPHAMHGLLLDQPVSITRRDAGPNGATLEAAWSKSFGGEWPGDPQLEFHASLTADAFLLKVTAANTGSRPCPIGIGWHPYFNIPSGDRRQAKLKIPAATRALVNNYDDVFPTGATESTAGSAYDFREPRALNGQFLDDCFLDLMRDTRGAVTAEIHDPAARYAIRITSTSPAVNAYQCYAPPEKPFIVLEPQFNLGDPFNQAIWKDRDTGMIYLAPGMKVVYDARVTVSAI